MIRIALTVALLGLVTLSASAQEADTRGGCSDAQTTLDMRTCYSALNLEADSLLVDALDKARERAGPGALALLADAQTLWEQYRDAQCEAEGAQYEGGSLQPVVVLSCRLEFTRSRTESLDGLYREPPEQPAAIPEVVEEAVSARQRGWCQKPPRIERDSLGFYPNLSVFVGRCENYFGGPETVAVALDPEGTVYLLDSKASFRFVETRLGRPVVDSTNVIEYALTAARLSGAIPWDSRLQTGTTPSPDPRSLAPGFPTSGECEPVRPPWIEEQGGAMHVGFNAATEWWVGSVTATVSETLTLLVSETLCRAMHNP